ncbi:hypothetical protein DOTSEDRAFT_39271 [Dothistroma septosporum NZE10]|uniref:Uncharacterized protein n=1 Tax=Dothistroma septosporum (strain NZE10 / CBS 128990) TaxID=675120 RepID=N1PBK6_DOTSN|nr:hypothetical protein DOTSEDRAFT_39271 [Dothistroma septosporum NZE10]
MLHCPPWILIPIWPPLFLLQLDYALHATIMKWDEVPPSRSSTLATCTGVYDQALRFGSCDWINTCMAGDARLQSRAWSYIVPYGQAGRHDEYPIASALPYLYGILVAACAKKLTREAYWNIWDVMTFMLPQYPEDHGARFGNFLIAVAMAFSYLADLTAMFPRWMTIRRGQILCTILGIAIVPWKLLNSAEAFLTFSSGYGCWLALIALQHGLARKSDVAVVGQMCFEQRANENDVQNKSEVILDVVEDGSQVSNDVDTTEDEAAAADCNTDQAT